MSVISKSTQKDLATHPDSLYWCKDHRGQSYSRNQAIKLIKDFHGHVAPGLVIGTKMVSLAMDQLPKDILFDAISETTSCLPDAVQMLTLCTIGNGWLCVKDLGRYAVILYNKFQGDGVRVFLDSEKLAAWPEFYNWFYKRKAKKDQDFDHLIEEIHTAAQKVLTIQTVKVKPSYLVRRSKGEIATCALCGEAFPNSHGSICRGCQGGSPCEILTVDTLD